MLLPLLDMNQQYLIHRQHNVFLEMHTSTMVVLAALHIGWLKFLAVFLKEKWKTVIYIVLHNMQVQTQKP